MRKKIHTADFIITNHNLLLSDLDLGGGVLLPEIEKSIYILDECHHLPEKAISHFAKAAAIMGSADWINQLTRTVGKAVQLEVITDTIKEKIQDSTHQTLQSLKPMQEYLEINLNQFDNGIWRLASVSEELLTLAKPIQANAKTICNHCYPIIETLEQTITRHEKSDPTRAQEAASVLGGFNVALSRAENLRDTWTLFCQKRKEKEPPIARWFSHGTSQQQNNDNTKELFHCHTSPINISDQLQTVFWDKIKNGVALCSATIRALGKFDDFRRRTGLSKHKSLIEKSVDSFFDYSQSVLFIPKMKAAPAGTNQHAHRQEAIQLLPQLFLAKSGTLVLFTSRAAMHETYEALEDQFGKAILMQGDRGKSQLITKHKKRIRQGQRSILFGLASFAEGLDLPADFCQHVIIHKLPFAVPSTPIELTRNEWLSENKLNAFMLSSLPKTSIRLTQYVGRLIRQEEDTGVVTILDKRLYEKPYGKQLVKNLPPFQQIIDAPITELLQTPSVSKLFQ